MAKSITLTKSQMDNINDIDINGAAIKDIIIEYSQHFISIPVIKPFPTPLVGILLFQGVVYSEVSSHQPFGEGCFILNFDVKFETIGDSTYFNINNIEELNALIKNNACFKATIELNSGDKINIIANQLLYSMEESDCLATSFVPDDFEVPIKLETEKFRLRMLSVSDAEKDYEAVMSSRVHIRNIFPIEYVKTWPEENMTLDENLEDLQKHQSEFLERKAFAYTVVNLDESTCLGCVYIDPSPKKDFDAVVSMWTRASEIESGLIDILFATIKKWIKDRWPFQNVAYPGIEIEWTKWSEL